MRTIGSVFWLLLLSCAAATAVLFVSILVLFSGVIDGLTSGILKDADDATIIKICVGLATATGGLVLVSGLVRVALHLKKRFQKQVPATETAEPSTDSSTVV